MFADYPLQPVGRTARRTPRSGSVVPDFRLGGLSKSAGLPQVKLGWIAVEGPDALVREALDRLELICDTYLSVSTPVQAAARSLIAAGAPVRRADSRARARQRRDARIVGRPGIQASTSCTRDAGWSAVMRVPATRSEEDLALELLERDGVLVHPGFFFDFPHEAFLVVSLLPEPDDFARRHAARAGAGRWLTAASLPVGMPARSCRCFRSRPARAGASAKSPTCRGWRAGSSPPASTRAVAAGQRDGRRTELAVLRDERDGDRSDLHRLGDLEDFTAAGGEASLSSDDRAALDAGRGNRAAWTTPTSDD